MTPQEIITADYQNNHQGREYSLQHSLDSFEKYVQHGGKYFVSGNTIFLIEPKANGVVEFHTINGGDGKDLSRGINHLLKEASQYFIKAITYYDNPRINDLLSHSQFKHTVKKINQGLDKTYELVFDLRSA